MVKHKRNKPTLQVESKARDTATEPGDYCGYLCREIQICWGLALRLRSGQISVLELRIIGLISWSFQLGSRSQNTSSYFLDGLMVAFISVKKIHWSAIGSIWRQWQMEIELDHIQNCWGWCQVERYKWCLARDQYSTIYSYLMLMKKPNTLSARSTVMLLVTWALARVSN